jgi:hypothetical protein
MLRIVLRKDTSSAAGTPPQAHYLVTAPFIEDSMGAPYFSTYGLKVDWKRLEGGLEAPPLNFFGLLLSRAAF